MSVSEVFDNPMFKQSKPVVTGIYLNLEHQKVSNFQKQEQRKRFFKKIAA